MDRQAPTEFTFDAFISFRHSDARPIARQLRDDLQRWRAPDELDSKLEGSLAVYLDTFQRRPTTDFWLNNVLPALHSSQYLIVILTPSVYKPLEDGSDNWVIREIREFLKTPQQNNIIPLYTDKTKHLPLPQVITDHLPRIQHFNIQSRDRFLPTIPFFEKPADLELSLIAGALVGIDASDQSVLLAEGTRRQNQYVAKVVSTLTIITLTIAMTAMLAVWQGIRATKNAFDTEIRVALESSELAPDVAALYATRALHIATNNWLFRAWMLKEEARARAILGVLALPESQIIHLGGRIEQLAVSTSQARVALTTDVGELALFKTHPLTNLFTINPSDMGDYQEIALTDTALILKRNSPSGTLVDVFSDKGKTINSLVFPIEDDVLAIGDDTILHRINNTGELVARDALTGVEIVRFSGQFTQLQAALSLGSIDRIVIHTDSDESYGYGQGIYALSSGQAVIAPRTVFQLDPTPRASAVTGTLVTQDQTGLLIRTDLHSGNVVSNFPELYATIPAWFHLSPSGEAMTLSRSQHYNSVELYDLNTLKWILPPITPFNTYTPPTWDEEEHRVSFVFKNNILLLNRLSAPSDALLPFGGQPLEQVFLDGGRYLAVADLQGRIYIFDTERLYPVVTGVNHRQGLAKLARIGDTHLLSAGGDKTLRLTELNPNPKLLGALNQSDQITNSAVLAIQFHPSKPIFAYTTSKNTVHLCEVRERPSSGQPLINCPWQKSTGHPVTKIQFVNGSTLLLASHLLDVGATIFDAETGEPLYETMSDRLIATDLSRTYITIDDNETLSKRRFSTPNSARQCRGLSLKNGLVELSRGGSILVHAQTIDSQNALVKAIDLRACEEQWSTQISIKNLQQLTIAPDNQSVIIGGRGPVAVLNLNNGNQFGWSIDEKNQVLAAEYSLDNSTLYLSGISGKIYARNLTTGALPFDDIDTNAIPWDIALSPDGSMLAISSVGNQREGVHGTALVDTKLGKYIGLPLPTQYPVTEIEFSADGHWLAAGDTNGGIKIWDIGSHQASYDDILQSIENRVGQTIDFTTGAIAEVE